MTPLFILENSKKIKALEEALGVALNRIEALEKGHEQLPTRIEDLDKPESHLRGKTYDGTRDPNHR